MLDFVTIIRNLAEVTAQDAALWVMINAFCYVAAMVTALSSVFQLKDAAEQGSRTTYKAPLFTFIAACMLAAAPESIKTFAATVFAEHASASPLSSIKSDPSVDSFRAIMQLISLFGYIFFVRGIFALKQAGQPERYSNASVGKAAVICTAGMAAIYIDVTLQFVANTTGWNISNYING